MGAPIVNFKEKKMNMDTNKIAKYTNFKHAAKDGESALFRFLPARDTRFSTTPLLKSAMAGQLARINGDKYYKIVECKGWVNKTNGMKLMVKAAPDLDPFQVVVNHFAGPIGAGSEAQKV